MSRKEGRLADRWATSVVQLVDFLPSMHTTLGSFLSICRLDIVVHTCNSSAGEVEVGTSGVKGHSWRQSKFEARLGYIKLCLEMKGRRKKRKEGGGGKGGEEKEVRGGDHSF